MKKPGFLFLAIIVSVQLAVVSQSRQPSVPTVQSTQPISGRQEATPIIRDVEAEERLQIAISSIDYPVTPGDIYRLTYRESGGMIQQREFQVDSVSLIDMGVFGKQSGANMTFFLLKQQVEEMIAKNYTYSLPSFTIISPGLFRITVRDGSSQIRYESAWGMTRLSEIAVRSLAAGFSMRNVEVISRNGEINRYDLLKAGYSNDPTDDPYIRSGDMVVFHEAKRVVELRGEVRRPGRYELVGDENIRELIEFLGGGLTNRAQADRVRIQRVIDTGDRTEYCRLPDDYDSVKKLSEGDIVIVSDKTRTRTLIWLEGAVELPPESQESRLDSASNNVGTPAGLQARTNVNRISHVISKGTKLSDVLAEVRTFILPNADFRSASITFAGNPDPRIIDLEPLMFGSDLSGDIVLDDDCVVHIPEVLSRISVYGAVNNPGFVQFRPGADAEYYISQSGGINPDLNNFGSFIVYNSAGDRTRRKDPIKPGDNIFVKNNDFSHNMERSVSIWVPVITLVITVLTFGMTTGAITY